MEDKTIFEMWETFKTLLQSTNREGINEVIKWLDESDFKFAPASTQYHNNFRGGLLKHSLDVYYHMFDYKQFIDFFNIPNETIILTSLLHDVCKIDCYDVGTRNVKNEEGQWVQVPFYKWNEKIPGLGHGTKSVIMLQFKGLKLNIIEIEAIANHMGFSVTTDSKSTSAVSEAFSKCPQSLILHWADEAATYTTESPDLQTRYREILKGRNISESLHILKQSNKIKIDNFEYELAPEDVQVDNEKVIYVNYNGQQVKVFAPHGDGLPF